MRAPCLLCVKTGDEHAEVLASLVDKIVAAGAIALDGLPGKAQLHFAAFEQGLDLGFVQGADVVEARRVDLFLLPGPIFKKSAVKWKKSNDWDSQRRPTSEASRVVPDTRILWRDVWAGALIASVLFVVGKFVLAFYFGRSAISSNYGPSGPLIIILLWVFYSAQIFFFGAEFTRVYAIHFGSQRSEIGPPKMD